MSTFYATLLVEIEADSLDEADDIADTIGADVSTGHYEVQGVVLVDVEEETD